VYGWGTRVEAHMAGNDGGSATIFDGHAPGVNQHAERKPAVWFRGYRHRTVRDPRNVCGVTFRCSAEVQLVPVRIRPARARRTSGPRPTPTQEVPGAAWPPRVLALRVAARDGETVPTAPPQTAGMPGLAFPLERARLGIRRAANAFRPRSPVMALNSIRIPGAGSYESPSNTDACKKTSSPPASAAIKA
jgi:hypothetical protein